MLGNRILPVGLPVILAKVLTGLSWVDDRECVVLAYSHSSLLAHGIHDEIREVALGLFLGVVFWERRKILNFMLDFER